MELRRWLLLAAGLLAGCGQLQPKETLKHERVPDMAETYWQSTGSTVFANGANWSGGVPGVGDVAVFDGRSQIDAAGSDQSGGGLLTAIRIQREYQGSIGTAGNPLVIPVSKVDHLGTGQVCIYLSAANLPDVSVDSGHSLQFPALRWSGYNPQRLDILRGKVWYDPTLGDETAKVTLIGGRLYATATSKRISLLLVVGGVAETNYKVSSTHVLGGTIKASGTTYNNVRIQRGEFMALDDLSHTGYVWAIGGTYDITRCTASHSLTRLSVYPEGDFVYNQDAYGAITTIRDLRNEFP